MNKYETILESIKHFSNILERLHAVALKINETEDETKSDFLNSKRTGQCGAVIQLGLIRVGAHYVPKGQTEEKIRYSIVANNKINFLLENFERKNTFPQNEEERIRFEAIKVFGGGIRIYDGDTLVGTSGFHPKIDEGCSIVVSNRIFGFTDNEVKIKHLQDRARYFNNPYALPMACGAGFIKSMSFDQAVEWGKNEISLIKG